MFASCLSRPYLLLTPTVSHDGYEKKGETQEEEDGQGVGDSVEGDGLRTPAEVLQEATRVTPKRLQGRMAQAPPGLESLQTENQRRRALPLSKLKRVKPKKR